MGQTHTSCSSENANADLHTCRALQQTVGVHYRSKVGITTLLHQQMIYRHDVDSPLLTRKIPKRQQLFMHHSFTDSMRHTGCNTAMNN